MDISAGCWEVYSYKALAWGSADTKPN